VHQHTTDLGSTDAIGKVFESYEGVWGLEPDADSYNAVLESCEGARKLSGVQGVMSLMTSRGVEPNTTSWNLLLSTAIRTGGLVGCVLGGLCVVTGGTCCCQQPYAQVGVGWVWGACVW